MLGGACNAAIQGFVSGSAEVKRDAYVDLAASLLAFILSIVILGFFGKLLWNNVIVDLISIAKPAKSFWQLVGLMVFVSLLFP
jgi:hypothetical protein